MGIKSAPEVNKLLLNGTFSLIECLFNKGFHLVKITPAVLTVHTATAWKHAQENRSLNKKPRSVSRKRTAWESFTSVFYSELFGLEENSLFDRSQTKSGFLKKPFWKIKKSDSHHLSLSSRAPPLLSGFLRPLKASSGIGVICRRIVHTDAQSRSPEWQSHLESTWAVLLLDSLNFGCNRATEAPAAVSTWMVQNSLSTPSSPVRLTLAPK